MAITPNVQINNIPSTRVTKVGYRTNLSSHEQNQFQEGTLNDILDLFNKLNTIENDIYNMSEVLDIENKYNDIKIQKLKDQYMQLLTKYNELNSLSNERLVYIDPKDVNRIGDPNEAYVDLENSDITIKPYSKTSKIYLYDEITDTVFLPASLKVDVEPARLEETVGVISVEDNDIFNMFDKTRQNYYVKKVTTDNTINEIILNLIITLPEDVITSRDINEIIISPFPNNSMDIINVAYRLGGTTWTDVAAFKSNVNYDHTINEISESPNIKLSTNNISANQLKITVRQKNYIAGLSNTRLFCLGFKNIEVFNNSYSADYNTISFDVTIPETNDVVIMGVDAFINNSVELATTNIIEYEYYYYDNDSILHKIIDTIPFSTNKKKLRVNAKIYNSSTTPNISHFELKYKII